MAEDCKFLAIKNWEKYQPTERLRYKNAKLPWIKVYTDLDDDIDWQELSIFQKGLLVGIWRLRARTARNLHNDAMWIARALHATPTDRPHIAHAIRTLIAHGFLIPTNEQLSLGDREREEKEIEREKKEQPAPAEPVVMPKPETKPKVTFMGVEPTTFELPVWVPEAEWIAWEQMRARLKPPRPLTNHARTLAVAKLSDLMNKGHPPKQVLEQSILNSWQGLFELKGGRNGNTGKPVRQSSLDRYKELCRERGDEHAINTVPQREPSEREPG